MHAAATFLLLVFAALSTIDGLYIHLWRLRLHQRTQSWLEHVWHTARAILFVPIVCTIFIAPTAGAVLWVGVLLLAIDQAAELLDLSAERASRRDLGGVGRGELALHVTLIAARTVAVILSLVARPGEAWSPRAPSTIGAHAAWIPELLQLLVPGAIAVALLHVVLAWRHRPACLSCCGLREAT